MARHVAKQVAPQIAGNFDECRARDPACRTPKQIVGRNQQPKQQKSQPDAMRQPRRQAVDKELDPVLRADRAEHRRGDGCHNDRVSAPARPHVMVDKRKRLTRIARKVIKVIHVWRYPRDERSAALLLLPLPNSCVTDCSLCICGTLTSVRPQFHLRNNLSEQTFPLRMGFQPGLNIPQVPNIPQVRCVKTGVSSMRIAQVAPLTEAIPPRLYGGTERVVYWLSRRIGRPRKRRNLVRQRQFPHLGETGGDVAERIAARRLNSRSQRITHRDAGAGAPTQRRFRSAAFPPGLLPFFAFSPSGHSVHHDFAWQA